MEGLVRPHDGYRRGYRISTLTHGDSPWDEWDPAALPYIASPMTKLCTASNNKRFTETAVPTTPALGVSPFSETWTGSLRKATD